jgi:hypothetical protein
MSGTPPLKLFTREVGVPNVRKKRVKCDFFYILNLNLLGFEVGHLAGPITVSPLPQGQH